MTPEYEQLIKTMSDRFAKKRSAAEARGIGEAQRRGLVNPTGTSDIEMGLRQAQTQPIEEAEAMSISQLIKQAADKQREERMITEGRAYGTSEREAGQRYGTAERFGRQAYGTGEREAGQRYGTGERFARQKYGTSEREAGQRYGTNERLGSEWYGTQERLGSQAHEKGMAEQRARLWKPKKRKWWQPLASAVGQGAGMYGGAYGMSKLPGMGG